MVTQLRRVDSGLGKTASGGTGGSFAAHLRPAGEPPGLRRKSADEFRDALWALDAELEALDLPEPVRLNAVGGFALLHHELRDDGFTVDIDTITPDFDPRVREAINRVSDGLELERDWINNEAAGGDSAHVSNMLDAVYLRQDFGFRNVELNVADIPTLTRAKAFAVSDSALSKRTRDWYDLLKLLEHQGISSSEMFRDEYPSVSEWEYPEVHQALDNYFTTGSREMPLEEEVFDIDALLAELAADEREYADAY